MYGKDEKHPKLNHEKKEENKAWKQKEEYDISCRMGGRRADKEY